MVTRPEVASRLRQHFPYEPTPGQEKAILCLADFVLDPDPSTLFMLRGYAGTGKTSLVSALVQMLASFRIQTVLLAPTGRAAKVLGSYSGKRAHTIHKMIYYQRVNADGSISLELAANRMQRVLFIVDEASMITDTATSSQGFSGRNLLADLFQFVYSGDRCRLMLIGDTAQLPPVGMNLSPALNPALLKASFHVKIYEEELTDVVRQAMESGILINATRLREKIAAEEAGLPLLRCAGYPDLIRISGYELQEALQEHCGPDQLEDSVIITRSNRRANLFNQEVRRRILYREGELNAGDLLMVVRNNYFWLEPESEAGFIANGDIIEVMRIANQQERYGLRFAELIFRMLDYPGQPEVNAMVMLDTLASPGPALMEEDQQRLFQGVMADHAHILNRQARLEAVRNDPWYNALQVKFAYALTCHKTQGGQWRTVFVDQGYLRDDMIGKEYLRWLYTALTRGTEKVFLVGFRDEIAED
ncbi:MAG TPA: AAA family ATPase [Bacteroidales bacterium]|nr:AAA family ATPase [Bacteroidales bacterium]HRZ75750.1 AAA family ATPase [Bacteroidales bacterium]